MLKRLKRSRRTRSQVSRVVKYSVMYVVTREPTNDCRVGSNIFFWEWTLLCDGPRRSTCHGAGGRQVVAWHPAPASDGDLERLDDPAIGDVGRDDLTLPPPRCTAHELVGHRVHVCWLVRLHRGRAHHQPSLLSPPDTNELSHWQRHDVPGDPG